VGWFSPLLDPRAWFGTEQIPEGWFGPEMIPMPALLPLVGAFIAVKPDYAHPTHDHDDIVNTATVDFLALAVVVALTLGRVREALHRRCTDEKRTGETPIPSNEKA